MLGNDALYWSVVGIQVLVYTCTLVLVTMFFRDDTHLMMRYLAFISLMTQALWLCWNITPFSDWFDMCKGLSIYATMMADVECEISFLRKIVSISTLPRKRLDQLLMVFRVLFAILVIWILTWHTMAAIGTSFLNLVGSITSYLQLLFTVSVVLYEFWQSYFVFTNLSRYIKIKYQSDRFADNEEDREASYKALGEMRMLSLSIFLIDVVAFSFFMIWIAGQDPNGDVSKLAGILSHLHLFPLHFMFKRVKLAAFPSHSTKVSKASMVSRESSQQVKKVVHLDAAKNTQEAETRMLNL
ncbi:hypothetical protein EDD86DRAFT_249853 [Gorgonomyces haynaldii]|nr:hypothetical protein EDD86DRAFT_249853 [Gorgonomyces haynaldii]